MCDIDVDDYCEVWVQKWKTARKEHRCASCEMTIARGDRYLHHFHVYDGDPSVEKACAVCGALWESFIEAHAGGYSPSSLDEMLHSCIDGGDKTEERQWRWYLAVVRLRQRRARSAVASLAGRREQAATL
jgi:hypothetical protein